MNDALVRKDYLKKIQKIHKLNKAYYEDSVPEISDQEYDSLKQQIIDLENKYKSLKSKLSPSISVGFKPSKNLELKITPGPV